MQDGAGAPPAAGTTVEGIAVHDYEELLAAAGPVGFQVDDENSASAMCYTSGTTGNPKGVVYSHRSVYLHTLAVCTTDSIGVGESDILLPVVPMFHANAWGLAHAGVAVGADIVMPGPDLSGKAIADLIVEERVTIAAGVPTIWMAVLPELKGRDTSSLRVLPCGGSAVPKALSKAYRDQIGLPILQAWGMTETSPVASTGRFTKAEDALPLDEQDEIRTTVGRPLLGVDCRVVHPDTTDLVPWDGETSGELQCRGPWIAATYYDDERASESFTDDGWLRTGDVAVVDAAGRLKLVDRTKDLIKSGGEWISSVEIENELMAHPSIAEAAVVGVPHPKWVERPLACVVVASGATLTKQEVLDFLAPKVAKWQLPDDVVFIDAVPRTSVGKFSKKTLRDRFADHVLPTA
jgi:fatty-acyl-CoA synthase